MDRAPAVRCKGLWTQSIQANVTVAPERLVPIVEGVPWDWARVGQLETHLSARGVPRRACALTGVHSGCTPHSRISPGSTVDAAGPPPPKEEVV